MANRLTISRPARPRRSGPARAVRLVDPLNRSRPRSVTSLADWSSTSAVYSLKISYRRVRVACCSLKTVSGLNRCGSPSRRHWYSPPTSRRRWRELGAARGVGRAGGARLLGEHVEADAAEAGGRPGEAGVDDLLAEADRLEDLRAGVGGDGGDAHLGHDLEHALAERLDRLRAALCGGRCAPSSPAATRSSTVSMAR